MTTSRASPATLWPPKVIAVSVTGTAQRSARPPAPGILSRRGAPAISSSATTAARAATARRWRRRAAGRPRRRRGRPPRRRAAAPRPRWREGCVGPRARHGGPRPAPLPPNPGAPASLAGRAQTAEERDGRIPAAAARAAQRPASPAGGSQFPATAVPQTGVPAEPAEGPSAAAFRQRLRQGRVAHGPGQQAPGDVSCKEPSHARREREPMRTPARRRAAPLHPADSAAGSGSADRAVSGLRNPAPGTGRPRRRTAASGSAGPPQDPAGRSAHATPCHVPGCASAAARPISAVCHLRYPPTAAGPQATSDRSRRRRRAPAPS